WRLGRCGVSVRGHDRLPAVEVAEALEDRLDPAVRAAGHDRGQQAATLRLLEVLLDAGTKRLQVDQRELTLAAPRRQRLAVQRRPDELLQMAHRIERAFDRADERCPAVEWQVVPVLAVAQAVGASDVERFAHGTTVATNALLERKGARTAFVTNAGFEHLLHLRRQTRAHLYRLCAAHPEPLVPLEGCFGVAGRMGTDGELEPLARDALPEIGAAAAGVCRPPADRRCAHAR